MKLKVVMVICILSASIVAVSADGTVRETTDKDIDRAIESAKKFLWNQQQPNGSWEQMRYCYKYHLPSGFPTAVITFALLEAGESYQNDERMARAIKALAEIKTGDLRFRALRVMALSRAVGKNKKSPYRKVLKADLKWLCGGRGKWGNAGTEKYGDNFCNHLALTALREAAVNTDLKIPDNIFRRAQGVWVKRQRPDGGWSFSALPGSKMAPDVRITAAGLASMYICQDALGIVSRKTPQQKIMSKAWEYLDKNFNDKFMNVSSTNSNSSYTGFCIQQLGMASGEKFINNIDWYAVAASELARPRPFGKQFNRNAFWGPLVRAAFELIILARGRLPLTFNKLNYGSESQWNFHPRDIARFSEYMQKQFERRMRWQIVRINDNVKSLLDSPIMLVGGSDAMELSDQQWQCLKEYTLRGGTLLFVPSGKDKGFLESVRAKLKTLYSAQRKLAGSHYELNKLPKAHPIYNIAPKIPNGSKKYPTWGVSDGTRLLAVICEKDIARAWQYRASKSRRWDFSMGVNIFRYATGRNSLSSRMRPVFTTIGNKPDIPISATMKVGWVKHGGNWCSQPFGLDYLAEKLESENQVRLKIAKGVSLEKDAVEKFELLWMTGSDAFELPAEQIAVLRKYLRSGGMLMLNAVGGSREFHRSAEQMLAKLFADDENIIIEPSLSESPIMTGKCGEYRGPRLLGKLGRTNAFMRKSPRALAPAVEYRNQAGRILVAYCRFGVHDTLDGHAAFGAMSFMPVSARGIAANIALYPLSNRAEKSNSEK